MTLAGVVEACRVASPQLASPEASAAFSQLGSAPRRFWADFYRTMLEHLGYRDEHTVAELCLVLSDSASYALFDDVAETLSAVARRGYVLAVTSNFEPLLQRILERQQVHHYFAKLVISTVEGVAKPDPEIYRRLLNALDLRPNQVLHVGDSFRHDVVPAHAIGITGVLLDRSGHQRRDGVTTIRQLSELVRVLETHEQRP